MKSTRTVFQILIAVILVAGEVSLLVGLFGGLFGPTHLLFLSIGGVLLTMLGSFGLRSDVILISNGAKRATVSDLLGALFGLGIALFPLCFVVSLAATELRGVPDEPAMKNPVFANRPAYFFQSHGHDRHAVSRTRYVVASAGFEIGWHSGFLAFNFAILRELLCREGPVPVLNFHPKQPKNS